MISFNYNLEADTAFPVAELREQLQGSENSGGHCLELSFFNASADWLRSTRTNETVDSGEFSMFEDHKGRLSLTFKIHRMGGRARFLDDVGLLKGILLESGGIRSIAKVYVFTSSCCDDLVAEAIAAFQNDRVDKQGMEVILSDRDGDADEGVLARIVDSCFTNTGVGINDRVEFSWSSKSMLSHRHTLQRLSSKCDVLDLSAHGESIMCGDILALVAETIRNNQRSPLRYLTLGWVPATAKSDALLADIIVACNGTNVSTVDINFNNSPEWIAAEMTRAMKEENFTLESVHLHPQPKDLNDHHDPWADDDEAKKKWSKQKRWALELYFLGALNSNGRGAMRGAAIPADVLLAFFVVASGNEGGRHGRYLFPILVETVPGWIGYLVGADSRAADHQDAYFDDVDSPSKVIQKCRAKLMKKASLHRY